MEALLRIADFLDGAADGGFDFFFGTFGPCAIFIDAFAANLASEDNQLRGGQCFARDARFGVFRQKQVDDRVGDLVRNLVWMSFGHGFGSEKVV